MLDFLKKINILSSDSRCGKDINIKNHEEEECLLPQLDSIEIIRTMDLSGYNDIEYDTESNKPKLLIVDDIDMTRKLYEFDFNSMLSSEDPHDVKEDFNVIYSTGAKCGYESLKLISKVDKIDYAILDLTLGYIERLPSGDVIEVDGIDLAIMILEKNPSAKIVFSTAHIIDTNNSAIREYVAKLYKYTKILLTQNSKSYINKNSDRVVSIVKLLYNG